MLFTAPALRISKPATPSCAPRPFTACWSLSICATARFTAVLDAYAAPFPHHLENQVIFRHVAFVAEGFLRYGRSTGRV